MFCYNKRVAEFLPGTWCSVADILPCYNRAPIEAVFVFGIKLDFA